MPFSGRRVLVVEDEAVIAAMIEEALLDWGAVVIGPAGSITRALALAGTEVLDAAVLDVNVRGERIDPVASLLRTRSVPIVFASGYGNGSAVQGPGETVLEKPFRLDDLASALAQALGSR